MSESFYLSQLDVDVTSSSATLSGSTSTSFTGDATVDVNVPLATIKELFQYQSDSIDVTDAVADDIKFRSVYATNVLPLGINIDESAPVVPAGAIDAAASNMNLTYDYVRYLALKLFNTHLGVDLFDNEASLRSNLNASFKTNLDDVLVAVNDDGVTDQSGTAPSRTVFNQLIANKPSRFNDITVDESALVDGKQWYSAPCAIDDIIYFRVTVAAAADQQKLTAPSSTTVIADRVYLIRATIVA
jgi:hypothetical protein